jgi:hypothetical protein
MAGEFSIQQSAFRVRESLTAADRRSPTADFRLAVCRLAGSSRWAKIWRQGFGEITCQMMCQMVWEIVYQIGQGTLREP